MFEEYGDIMTVPEIMEALHIGKNQVYALLKSGEIKAFRMGLRSWTIPKESVVAYIKNQINKKK